MAPLLASISLDKRNFYVLVFQKVFDQIKSIISRLNLLLSFESKEQLIEKWLILSIITIAPAIY